ncbi:Transient receptor potential cation channel subfamily A member 1 [Trichoplax sp. H2]|nr:Transient receptor potential cation channel subfamily A member 1 [Trichoplax sp. H2]|eukprot:RDD38689.1 Transient receptor potential cation channel subfamily A member 1 [Trichoplax sp. H2]
MRNVRDCCYEAPLDIACIKGNTQVIQILIGYGVAVNSINRLEESALHIAAHHGQAEIVKLLMDHGADAKIENCCGKNCLEVAIENGQVDVAIEIAIRPCNHDMLFKVGDDGSTIMQSIVKWNSKVASAIMDTYITKTPLTENHNSNMVMYKIVIRNLKLPLLLQVEYDFSILDPGIEFEKNHNPTDGIGSFNAIKTIASSDNISLLEHPLSVKLLDTKWLECGRYIYSANLAVYTIYVTILVFYILQIERLNQSTAHKIIFLGFTSISSTQTTTTTASSSCNFSHTANQQHKNGLVFHKDIHSLVVWKVVIYIFAIINICRELYQLYHERIRYLLSFENYLELFLHSAILAFVANPDYSFNTISWALESLVIQISFIDLILFLRKLPIIGKYVLMMHQMIWTAAKVMVIMIFLLFGFAISFYTLCYRQMSFYSMSLSFVKVIDMLVGELNYSSLLEAIRKGSIAYPDAYMLLFLIIIFIFFIPIIMMNLLIGLAVGDITEMEKEASLRRLADLADFFYNIDRALIPRFRHYYAINKIKCKEFGNINMLRNGAKEQKQAKIISDTKVNSGMQTQSLRLDALQDRLRLMQYSLEKALHQSPNESPSK